MTESVGVLKKQQAERTILRYSNRIKKTVKNPRNPAIVINRL